MNNRYLDFVQTRGLITVVSDNNVDNNLKEFLVYLYSSTIVHNRLNKKVSSHNVSQRVE